MNFLLLILKIFPYFYLIILFCCFVVYLWRIIETYRKNKHAINVENLNLAEMRENHKKFIELKYSDFLIRDSFDFNVTTIEEINLILDRTLPVKRNSSHPLTDIFKD